MKDLKVYINEALSANAKNILKNSGVSKYFNADNKCTKSIKNIKTGDTAYLIRISTDTQDLIKEYKFNTIDVTDGGWPKYSFKNIKDLPPYLDKRKNYEQWSIDYYFGFDNHMHKDVTVQCDSYDDNEMAFIVWNKENKDTFIKWIKSLNDDYFDKITKQAEKEAEERKKAEEERKKLLNKKYKKKIRKNLSNLAEEVSSKGESYSLEDLSKEIKDKWGITISAEDLEKNIFGDFQLLNCCTLGDSGELENTFWDTLGNDSYVDVLPYNYTIGKTEDDYEVIAYFGMDKNYIFICMIEDENGDYNILCM